MTITTNIAMTDETYYPGFQMVGMGALLDTEEQRRDAKQQCVLIDSCLFAAAVVPRHNNSLALLSAIYARQQQGN